MGSGAGVGGMRERETERQRLEGWKNYGGDCARIDWATIADSIVCFAINHLLRRDVNVPIWRSIFI